MAGGNGLPVPKHDVQRVMEDGCENLRLVVYLPGVEAATDIQVRCGSCHIHVDVAHRYSLAINLDCEVHDEAESVKFLRRKEKLKASFLVITATAKKTAAAEGVPRIATADQNLQAYQAQQKDLDLLQRVQQHAQQHEATQLQRKAAAQQWVSHGLAAVGAGDAAAAKAALLRATDAALYPESETRELMLALTQLLQQQLQGGSSSACHVQQDQSRQLSSFPTAQSVVQDVASAGYAPVSDAPAAAAAAAAAAASATTSDAAAAGKAGLEHVEGNQSWLVSTVCRAFFCVCLALVLFSMYAVVCGAYFMVVEPVLGFLTRLGIPVRLTKAGSSAWWLINKVCSYSGVHEAVKALFSVFSVCCHYRTGGDAHSMKVWSWVIAYAAWVCMLALCGDSSRGVTATCLAYILALVHHSNCAGSAGSSVIHHSSSTRAVPLQAQCWVKGVCGASFAMTVIGVVQKCFSHSFIVTAAAHWFVGRFAEAVFTVHNTDMPWADYLLLQGSLCACCFAVFLTVMCTEGHWQV